MAFRVLAVVSLLSILTLALAGGEPGKGFRLKSGDCVVLLGNGFIEHERIFGDLETLITTRFPDADVRFRNLGWGGDTVRGTARTGGYQNPDGIARVFKEMNDLKPTVVFLGYGMNESFDGPQGLPRFIEDYDALLTKLALGDARVVLLSPTYHEDLGRPLPDPVDHNRDLEEYTAALKKLAARRGLAFVDLFHALRDAKQTKDQPPLTTNGILLTGRGYALVARAIAKQLHVPEYAWRLELNQQGRIIASAGVTVEKINAAPGVLRFAALDSMLPATKGVPAPDGQHMRVTGLPAGEYQLAIDGKDVLRAPSASWNKGVTITDGPAFGEAAKLREAIVRANSLFYRRWRPFNDHSRHWGFMQGDFALYDREIAEQEGVIAQLRRPRTHTYILSSIREMK